MLCENHPLTGPVACKTASEKTLWPQKKIFVFEIVPDLTQLWSKMFLIKPDFFLNPSFLELFVLKTVYNYIIAFAVFVSQKFVR